MDLGSGLRSSGKRSQPALERGDDPKRAKRTSIGPKASSAAAPFDLARILPGALEAAKLRQQYVFLMPFRAYSSIEGISEADSFDPPLARFFRSSRDAISRSHKTLEGMLSVFKAADDVMQTEAGTKQKSAFYILPRFRII